MRERHRRLPAEWEPQAAVMLAWPQEHMDWATHLEAARCTLAEIRQTIERFQPVLMVGPEGFALDLNDTWCRDIGPITIEEDGQPVLLDFTFNGWGGKYAAELDNTITRRLHAAGAFGKAELRSIEMVLEGGSIESDGAGTLLTTAPCLLNENRNAHLSMAGIEHRLKEEFGLSKVIWLKNGHLEGDDTDSHIDTLARLCPEKTILYVSCDQMEDEHFPGLKAMEWELQALEGYRLLPLPWPQAQVENGQRLPATYANYLVINGAVLVPTYNDPADPIALEVIGQAFPEREIIGIDCRALIRQGGSLHCATMQIPQGVICEEFV